jgi:hypothetical protein
MIIGSWAQTARRASENTPSIAIQRISLQRFRFSGEVNSVTDGRTQSENSKLFLFIRRFGKPIRFAKTSYKIEVVLFYYNKSV